MAVVDARSVGDQSSSHTNPSEKVSSCCGVSTPLFMHLIMLSKLEEDSTYMILQPFQLHSAICSGFDFHDPGMNFPTVGCRGTVRRLNVFVAMPT